MPGVRVPLAIMLLMREIIRAVTLPSEAEVADFAEAHMDFIMTPTPETPAQNGSIDLSLTAQKQRCHTAA